MQHEVSPGLSSWRVVEKRQPAKWRLASCFVLFLVVLCNGTATGQEIAFGFEPTSLSLSVTSSLRTTTGTFRLVDCVSDVESSFLEPEGFQGSVSLSLSPLFLPDSESPYNYEGALTYTAPGFAEPGFAENGTVSITSECANSTLTVGVAMAADPEPVTSDVDRLDFEAVRPGEEVAGSFRIFSGSPPISMTTELGIVTPGVTNESGALIAFSYQVPTDAVDGQVVEGVISATDSDGTSLTIPVRITVVSDSEALSSDVERLDFEAVGPGDEVTASFRVFSGSPPISVTTELGSVTPGVTSESGALIAFSYQVPTDTVDGQVVEGVISVMDAGGASLTIPVRISLGRRQDLGELPGLTPRQRAVAGALDNACGSIRMIPESEWTAGQRDLVASCERVRDSGSPGSVLDGLAPEEVAAQGRSSVVTVRQQAGNVGERMQQLRGGLGGGFDVSRLALNVDGQMVPVALIAGALGGTAGDLADSGRLGVFINGSGVFGSRRGTSNETGLDYKSLGLTAGVDYRFTPNTVGGVALGLIRSDTDFKDDSGGVDVDGYSVSLYGMHYTPQQFHIDAILTLGRNEYDTVRTVFSGPDGQRAISKPKGNEVGLGISGGYDFVQGARTISLLAGIDYIRGRIDAFEERPSSPGTAGAGSLLAIERQTVESLTTELAVQMAYAYPWRAGVLLPTVRLGLENEHKGNSRSINARFVHDPTATRFSVTTDDPDRTYFNLGAGLSAQFTRGRSAFLFVETVEGKSGVSEQRVDLGFRMEF